MKQIHQPYNKSSTPTEGGGRFSLYVADLPHEIVPFLLTCFLLCSSPSKAFVLHYSLLRLPLQESAETRGFLQSWQECLAESSLLLFYLLIVNRTVVTMPSDPPLTPLTPSPSSGVINEHDTALRSVSPETLHGFLNQTDGCLGHVYRGIEHSPAAKSRSPSLSRGDTSALHSAIDLPELPRSRHESDDGSSTPAQEHTSTNKPTYGSHPVSFLYARIPTPDETEDEPDGGVETPKWQPHWLHPAILSAFSILFTGIMITLIFLAIYSAHNNGLVDARDNMVYVWRFGATACEP